MVPPTSMWTGAVYRVGVAGHGTPEILVKWLLAGIPGEAIGDDIAGDRFGDGVELEEAPRTPRNSEAAARAGGDECVAVLMAIYAPLYQIQSYSGPC